MSEDYERENVERLIGRVGSEKELKMYAVRISLIVCGLSIVSAFIVSQVSFLLAVAAVLLSIFVSYRQYRETMRLGRKALKSWKNLDPKVRGENQH